MHIAASDPRYVEPEDVTTEDLEREKEIYRAQAAATGKPAPVIEKIVDGKMAKFYEEVCLLEQPFIKDQAISVKELIAQKVGKLGENITVRRFARFKVGTPDWTVAQTKAVEAAESSRGTYAASRTKSEFKTNRRGSPLRTAPFGCAENCRLGEVVAERGEDRVCRRRARRCRCWPCHPRQTKYRGGRGCIGCPGGDVPWGCCGCSTGRHSESPWTSLLLPPQLAGATCAAPPAPAVPTAVGSTRQPDMLTLRVP